MESDFDAFGHRSGDTPHGDGHGDTTRRNDEAAAREALSALDSDRRMLADRIRTPAWYYPLLAVATAFIIGSPGAGMPGQPVLVAFGCLGIVFLSLAYQRITGLTVTRTAGPRSLAIAVVLGIVIVLLLGVSFALAATGHAAWVWVTAIAAFAAMWAGGSLYDRAYSRELRRGR
ncbi:hypothetical protein C5B96_12570 [Subtercola sp. Z020]|uniref:hypothetical protein n=1 Tax=Subtercola sp. Z020 TaxID=2080582 RepID=UPI000CE77323|nr:hypothetical protein [Subtercola sp. Z020]PPF79543.1 hypothetical protein C5B96_12570 [Subtercola sp. Z020]